MNRNDKHFTAALADPTSRNFLPRRRWVYSSEEAEQDAYFWFLTGQKSMLDFKQAEMEMLVEKVQGLISQLEALGVRSVT